MGIYNSNGDFNKYRFFYAVAECQSFSKASELLCISQPAVSHAIKDLEEQLEVELFTRKGKKVLLTEEGEKLYSYIARAFDNIVAGERAIKERNNELTGKVRIGIYTHISTFILPDFISEFNKRYPKAKFVIFSASDIEMKEKLRNRELDLVILHYPIFIDEDDFKEEKLFELESCFFGSKKYYDLFLNSKNKEKIECPLILPMKGYPDTNILEKYLKKNNIVLHPNYRIYATHLKRELAKRDLGICWGTKKCIEQDIKNKELYVIPLDIKCPSMEVSIAYDESYINKTAKTFIKELKEYYQNQTKL